MELTPDLQEQIDNYLNGSLTGTDLQAFETQLTNDQALAAEVAFQREVKEMLADTLENALRKNLEALNQQVVLPKKKGNNWKWGVGLLPFLLVGAWWLLQTPPSEVPPDNIFEEADDSISTVVPTGTPPDTLGPVASAPPSELLAFEPNPALEALIEKNNENPSFQLTADNWQTEFEIATSNDSLPLQLTNRITSDLPLLKADLHLHLYNNEETNFNRSTAISTHPLNLQQANPTTYLFNFQQTYLLTPGRYYVVIQDATQTNTYFVEAFVVRLAAEN